MPTVRMHNAPVPQPSMQRLAPPSRRTVPGQYELTVDRFMSIPVRLSGSLRIEPTSAPQGLRLTSTLPWPKYTSILEESYNAAKGQYERRLSINGQPTATGVSTDGLSAAERIWRYYVPQAKRTIVSKERFGQGTWSQTDEFLPFLSTRVVAKRS